MIMNNSALGGRGTVSHFEEWVFNKTNPTYVRPDYKSELLDRQKLGRFTHSQIQLTRGWVKQVEAAKGLSSSWELVYADPHDDSDSRIFNASCLTVDGKPMRGKPDVVLRDTETGTIIIIERKVTSWEDKEIPKYAWPNIRAQLWCYSWMDDWVNASDIVLICQFWRRRIEKGRQVAEGAWLWNWDIRPAWRRSTAWVDSQCLQYFIEYGGKFIRK